MAKTLAEQFEEALIARGEKYVKTTAHYRVFTRDKGGFYFIGRAGALRIGTMASRNVPVTNEFKQKLLGEGVNAAQAFLNTLGLD